VSENVGKPEREGKGKKKTVTIRNIDEELYAKASALAKSIGESVGEIINEALRAFLSIAEGSIEFAQKVREGVEATVKITTVSDLEELTVTSKDLEEIEGRVKFRNIRKLVIDNSVTWELFDKKIASIVFVDKVVLPKHIPKLKALSKMKLVKKIEQLREEEEKG